MYFKNDEALIIIENLVKDINNKADFLSEVDGKIGDGDHGVNMSKGFSLCGTRIANKKLSMSEGFKILGETLLSDIGGSMGPLYGLFFITLSEHSEGIDKIDEHVYLDMISSALGEIQAIGNAKKGDKTLLDTLIPAVGAFRNAIDSGKDFSSALDDLDTAANEGWLSTENMIAKIGRASRLGERSIGVLDAGATSCYIILKSISDSIKNILVKD